MKVRIQKAVLLSGAMLYLLTAAAYFPGSAAPLSAVIADNSGSPSLDGGVMQPQGDPYPICPTCTPMGGN